MRRLLFVLASLVVAVPAVAQTTAASKQSQAASPYYPAPPKDGPAPQVQEGAPTSDLTSPLAAGQPAVTRTLIDSDAEAQLFSGGLKLVWGRYAKIKGAKPGTVTVTKQGAVWTIKGRLDSAAPGAEGDWTSIDGTVERIAANSVVIRGEVAFRVAKLQNGTPCKVAGKLTFKRSGKSQTWRLSEGDNPCDGTQEMFDLVHEKPVEKKPVPTQPKRS